MFILHELALITLSLNNIMYAQISKIALAYTMPNTFIKHSYNFVLDATDKIIKYRP